MRPDDWFVLLQNSNAEEGKDRKEKPNKEEEVRREENWRRMEENSGHVALKRTSRKALKQPKELNGVVSF